MLTQVRGVGATRRNPAAHEQSKSQLCDGDKQAGSQTSLGKQPSWLIFLREWKVQHMLKAPVWFIRKNGRERNINSGWGHCPFTSGISGHELCSWRGTVILLCKGHLYWNFAKGTTAKAQGTMATAVDAVGYFEAWCFLGDSTRKEELYTKVNKI